MHPTGSSNYLAFRVYVVGTEAVNDSFRLSRLQLFIALVSPRN